MNFYFFTPEIKVTFSASAAPGSKPGVLHFASQANETPEGTLVLIAECEPERYLETIRAEGIDEASQSYPYGSVIDIYEASTMVPVPPILLRVPIGRFIEFVERNLSKEGSSLNLSPEGIAIIETEFCDLHPQPEMPS
jgi:hypothetical protein